MSELHHPPVFNYTPRHLVLIAALALAALLTPVGSVAATLLEVEKSGAVPGFHSGELRRYLALHMTEAQLGDWRFEPAKTGDAPVPNRVEWSFKLNPHAGGGVRSFVLPRTDERIFGVYRHIKIEVRLYLNGEYQTLASAQAVVQGGPEDPKLAAVVANLTRSLLGTSGAYGSMDAEQRRSSPPK